MVMFVLLTNVSFMVQSYKKYLRITNQNSL